MNNSILHFIENDSGETENLTATMLKGEKESHDRMLGIGGRLVAKLYEKIVDEIKESLTRKNGTLNSAMNQRD